ncbi:aminodeoxychorismate synthase, component I [Lentzea sp. NBRC 105346]|uniref:aminodeoxychorismate synthase component I n=1 Tax=Lentzea sp. NBRC 105346 TaxID=3032205 RepID=UPI00249FC70D|nr:aminodeoxychorismate synthase component I [Lentzea sp. NBRC 105346]GLZ36286.1 aminodeoxychorismate synthase, component I [Lentzea sp. NBRC 105346]
MRTLLIDNHDSYTYNLFQLMAEVYGTPPVVVTNDDERWSTLSVEEFEAIVVSPGPGHPGRARDLGAVRQVLRDTEVPLLGVCLGHQAIALVAGAEVVGAPEPKHGHLTRVRHNGSGVFDGLPQDFTAVRYHSLCVPPESLPPNLEATAWAEDGVLMGLRHRERPMWGVQFHPESIASEHGAWIIENFGRLAAKTLAEQGRALNSPIVHEMPALRLRKKPANRWHVLHREIDFEVDTAAAFTELFGHLDYAFWLDSARVEPGLSRFSFFGAPEGPHGEVLTYDVDEGVFDELRARLSDSIVDAPDVPFDLTAGYVGYFGYELKGELGSPNRHHATTPDAVWMSTTRLVVVDHELRNTHLIALTRDDYDYSAQAWLDDTERRIQSLQPLPEPREPFGYDPGPGLMLARQDYLDNVEACQRQLHAGESYEICLTTRTSLPLLGTDPLKLYLVQRRTNPAPYAAFLRLGGVSVMCSSPERFLRVERDGTVESKPIKGTAPRRDDLLEDARSRASLTEDPKVRAENLMIVDLLRNDLGRVCEIGSVHVPRYMAVESYATVHQLVSTIRGTMLGDLDVIDVVRACFPGGSMTGAPKLRTMEIIDQLESTARGIFSGSIGFLCCNGTADLNIVIRTAVSDGQSLSIGAGGAIVLDSVPEEEFEEMLLKARAPMRGHLVPGKLLEVKR